MKFKFPNPTSFASNFIISIKEAKEELDLSTIFYMSLSYQAYQELENMQVLLEDTPY